MGPLRAVDCMDRVTSASRAVNGTADPKAPASQGVGAFSLAEDGVDQVWARYQSLLLLQKLRRDLARKEGEVEELRRRVAAGEGVLSLGQMELFS